MRASVVAGAAAVLAAGGIAAAAVAPWHGHGQNQVTASLEGTLTAPNGGTDGSLAYGIGSLAYGNGGDTLTTADTDGNAYTWNTATRHLVGTLAGAGSPVGPAAFSPDGGSLATDNGQGVSVWNLTTRQRTGTISPTCPCALGPGGTTLAAQDGARANVSYLWDVRFGDHNVAVPEPGSAALLAAVAYSPDRTTLALGYANARTYLFDTRTQAGLATLTDSGGKGTDSLAFSADGTTLATGDHNGSTYLWSVAAHRLIAVLPNPGGTAVQVVALSPDGKLLAATGAGSVYVWSTTTRKLIATLPVPGKATPLSAAFSPRATALALGADNGKAYLWHLNP